MIKSIMNAGLALVVTIIMAPVAIVAVPIVAFRDGLKSRKTKEDKEILEKKEQIANLELQLQIIKKRKELSDLTKDLEALIIKNGGAL